MPLDLESADERTKLLRRDVNGSRLDAIQQEDAQSIIGSYVSKDEQALSSAPVGERLPYNDYTTIDWLHDLVTKCLTSRRALGLMNPGQRLLPVSLCIVRKRHPTSSPVYFRDMLRLDRSCPYRHPYCLCCLPRRRGRSYRERLEAGLLLFKHVCQSRELLHHS